MRIVISDRCLEILDSIVTAYVEMLKILFILLFGLTLQGIGIVLISKGLHEIGDIERISVNELERVVIQGATNGYVLLGLLFLVLFFACLLYLLSQTDVSFIWPLTSLGLVLTVLAAHFIRNEEVSALRWSGVVLIVVGAAVVAWTGHQKEEGAGYENMAVDDTHSRSLEKTEPGKPKEQP